MSDSSPKISIVFPNLEGNKKNLKKLLDSVKAQDYPQKLIEVVMVDNDSKDDSMGFVKRNFPKVKIIKLEANYGFAKAVNLGIKKAAGGHVFVTNNDVLLEKQCLNNLVNFSKSHHEVGVTGPVIFEKRNRKRPFATLKYNLYTGLFKKLNNATESDWVTGAGMFFSKKLWQAIGGFDEGFFFTFEDLDFCLRIKRAGLKILHCSKAYIWHNEGSTVNLPNFAHLKYYEGYKSKLRLLLKHGNIIQIITALFLQFLVFAPYRFLILGEKSFVPLLQALIWNLKHFSQTLSSRRKIHEARLS